MIALVYLRRAKVRAQLERIRTYYTMSRTRAD